jgi:hypothetical protein
LSPADPVQTETTSTLSLEVPAETRVDSAQWSQWVSPQGGFGRDNLVVDKDSIEMIGFRLALSEKGQKRDKLQQKA